MKTQKVGFLRHAYVVFCVLFGLSLVAVDVVNAADVDFSVSEQYGITFPTKLVDSYSSGRSLGVAVGGSMVGMSTLPIVAGAKRLQHKSSNGAPSDSSDKEDKALGGIGIAGGALIAAGSVASVVYNGLRLHRLEARRDIVNDVNFPAELKGQDPNIQTAKAWLVAAYLWNKKAYVLAADIEKKVKKQKQSSAEEVRAQILSDNQAAIASAIEEIYQPFLLLKKDQQIAVVHALLEGNSYGSVSTKMENFLEANAKEMPTA